MGWISPAKRSIDANLMAVGRLAWAEGLRAFGAEKQSWSAILSEEGKVQNVFTAEYAEYAEGGS